MDPSMLKFASVSAMMALCCFQPAMAATKLASHRAVYDLTLVKAESASNITDARGRIVFEFTGNACDGYVLNFRQVTEITDSENGARVFDSRNATWEEGDGKTFRFDAERRANAQVTESGRGRAEREGGSEIAVRIDRPQKKDALVDRAVFPTQQLNLLLDAARAGKSIFESRVFDGSDGSEKAYDTTAVIGAMVDDKGEGLDEDIKKLGLESARRWPVTMSYFETGAGERRPVSVVSYDLLENGMTNKMSINFGDFIMSGEPSQVELLKDEPCNK
jgi:hypothetical protein